MKKKTRINVGIDEIAGVIPKHFISVGKIAKEYKLPLEYVNNGLGLIEARIPYKTTLEELIVKAVKKLHYSDVERFIFATESDYDLSKAVLAIKTLKKLKLNIVPFQFKFACLAGIQALLSACEYSATHNKPSIVVAVDRSIYKNSKAEITQGSGVVAMRIEKNPKILSLDFLRYGQYAEDIDDFKVPARKLSFPKVNGPLTKPTYIKCTLNAIEDYKEKNSKLKSLTKKTDYIVMHTPFPKIVVWAVATLWRYENSKEKNILSLLNKCTNNPKLFKKFKKLIDETRKTKEFKEFFKKKVGPGLRYGSHIGNSYNASIFISLISALEKTKAGQKISIIGYGSGAGSISLMGKVVNKNFHSNLSCQLKAGKELSITEYKRWRTKEIKEMQG